MAVRTVMKESERKGVNVRTTSLPEGESDTETKFFFPYSLLSLISYYFLSYSYTIMSDGETDRSSPV